MKWLDKIFSSSKKSEHFRVKDLESLLNADDIYANMIELHDIVAKACDCGHNLERLSKPQKNFYLVQTFMAEVNSGGFDAYFFNSYGDHAHETLAAPREIGSEEIAEILQQAIDEFPDGVVPKDHGMRQDLLVDEGLSEKAEAVWNRQDDILQREIKDDIDAMCNRYVSNHRDAF